MTKQIAYGAFCMPLFPGRADHSLISTAAAVSPPPVSTESEVAATDPVILSLSSMESASMLLNSQSLNAMYTAFNTKFQIAFDGAPSTYEKVAMVVPSSAREETYAWLSAIPRIREWIGERHIFKLSAHGYTLKNRKFESTIEVSRDDVADDRIGVFTPALQEMGLSAKQHPDELVYSALAAGFTEKCYDGQNFFDTDHPIEINGVASSVSNMQAGGGPAWFLIDGSRAVKPLVFQTREPYTFQRMDNPSDRNVFMQDIFLYGIRARANAGYGLWQLAYASKDTLDYANYAAARAAMMAFKDDYGRPLGVRPTLLVVPPALEGDARKIVVNTTKDSGAANEWAGTAEPIVAHWLA